MTIPEANVTESVLERSGSEIRYRLAGPEDAPLIVLTHGSQLDHRMFGAQLPALFEEGYRVLTWDLRGHGLSGPLGDCFSAREAALDLLAILDRLGIERASFVGHCLGAKVSQELVFLRPERAGALVAIGSGCITDRPPGAAEKLLPRVFPFVLKLWPRDGQRRWFAKNTAERPEVREYAYDAAGRVSGEDLAAVFGATMGCQREEPGYRLELPLLITRGEKDNLGSIGEACRTWARRDPNSSHVVVPEAGHNANQDNPEFFNRVLLGFLREHVPSPASLH